MRPSPSAPDRAALPLAASAAATALPLAASAAALALLPAVASGRSPIAVPLGLGLLLALSIARPPLGLAAAAALVPLAAWITRAADLEPLRLAEALALAVLAGTCLRLAFSPRPGAAGAALPAGGAALSGGSGGPPRGGAAPPAARAVATVTALPAGVGPAVGAVAAVTGAAVIVDLAPAQAGPPGTWLLVTDAAAQLSADYLYGALAILPGLPHAALLLEGVGLALAVAAWSRRHPGLPRRLAAASLAGAGAAAAVNLDVLAAGVAAAADPPAMLATYLRGGRRLAGHVADVNATGSYFLMTALAGIGLAAGAATARGRALAAAAAAAAGAAFWLAGSRAALAAAVLAGAVAVARRLRRGRAGGPVPNVGGRRRAAALAGAALALVALPLVVIEALPERGGLAGLAAGLRYRTEFTATSLRMWATAPVFGVGAGRYYELSDRFMGPWLAHRYRQENAHNNFLQIAAELGAIGIAAFVWLLAAAGRSVWRAPGRPARSDPLLLGLGAGAGTFLITCLAGHPLLAPETAYPFWILAGAAVALAHEPAPAARAAERAAPPRGLLRPSTWSGPRRPARGRAAAAAVALLLLITLPARIDEAARAMMRDTARTGLDGIAGAHGVETGPAGRPFRWTGPRATFFAPGDAGQARIRLRAIQAAPGRRVAVDVAVDGRRVMRVPLPGPDWIEVAVPLAGPGSTRALARIDLLVARPWTAHERRNGDPRTLGVMVGEIAFGPPARRGPVVS